MEDWLEPGVIGEVTTRSGKTFLAQWTLAPGIDYYWRPLGDVDVNYLSDPIISVEPPEVWLE